MTAKTAPPPRPIGGNPEKPEGDSGISTIPEAPRKSPNEGRQFFREMIETKTPENKGEEKVEKKEEPIILIREPQSSGKAQVISSGPTTSFEQEFVKEFENTANDMPDSPRRESFFKRLFNDVIIKPPIIFTRAVVRMVMDQIRKM